MFSGMQFTTREPFESVTYLTCVGTVVVTGSNPKQLGYTARGVQGGTLKVHTFAAEDTATCMDEESTQPWQPPETSSSTELGRL